MSIELNCSLCGAVNAFTTDQGGSLGRCGQCHTPLYVPRPEEMPAPASIRRSHAPKAGSLIAWVAAAAVCLLGTTLLVGGYVLFCSPRRRS